MNDPFPHLLIGDQILDGWRRHQPDIWPTNKAQTMEIVFQVEDTWGQYKDWLVMLVKNWWLAVTVLEFDIWNIVPMDCEALQLLQCLHYCIADFNPHLGFYLASCTSQLKTTKNQWKKCMNFHPFHVFFSSPVRSHSLEPVIPRHLCWHIKERPCKNLTDEAEGGSTGGLGFKDDVALCLKKHEFVN